MCVVPWRTRPAFYSIAIRCRTVKGRSRPTIICVVVQIDKPMLFCIGFKHLLLMNNAIAVTVSVIIARKPLI